MTREEVLQQTFLHSVDIQIRFTDMDTNGHINNGIYHTYYDLGRMGFFKEVLKEKTSNSIIAQVNTTYVKPLYLNDIICVKNKVVRWGNSSFDMLQAIFKKDGDSLVLANFNVTTFVHIENEKPSPVPVEWKNAVMAFENSIL